MCVVESEEEPEDELESEESDTDSGGSGEDEPDDDMDGECDREDSRTEAGRMDVMDVESTVACGSGVTADEGHSEISDANQTVEREVREREGEVTDKQTLTTTEVGEQSAYEIEVLTVTVLERHAECF